MTISRKVGFWLLVLTVALPGCAGVCVFGYTALVDWRLLQTAYAHYEQTVAGSADFKLLFAAEAEQNIHRVNLFADGVWALLSAILAAIGLSGMCLLSISNPPKTSKQN